METLLGGDALGEKMERLLKIQAHIHHILSSRFTPEQIADHYLSFPLQVRVCHDERLEEGERRLDVLRLRSLRKRAQSDRLISEVASAVIRFEGPVLYEHQERGVDVPELKTLLSKSAEKMEGLVADISALNRTLLQPLTPTTKEEIKTRLVHLQEVYDQGYVRISRQQETALADLMGRSPEAVQLVEDFVLIRDSNRPDETYTRALALIVYRLLCASATTTEEKKIRKNEKLAVDVIHALSPNLKRHVDYRTLKSARTRQ